jgi:hypothetical protein
MKNKHLKKLVWISLALIVLITIYLLCLDKVFCSWTEKGTFGDSFGALNTLFSGLAFAGLLITILIQKEELKDQKNEFLLNRVTGLVYNQLERFENAISKLKISDKGQDYFGDSAISHLDKSRFPGQYNYTVREVEDRELENKKQINRKNSELHIANKNEIEKFAQNIYNSVEVLKSLLYTTSLDIHDLNELKKLFFDNIGFTTMGVIKHISDTDIEQLKLFESEDYMDFQIEVGALNRANVFLKPVIAFYEVRFTKENIEELKSDWKKRSGRS